MGSRHGRTTDSARPSPERAKQTQPWRARCRVSSSRRRNKVCHARAMRGRAVRPFALVANTPPNLRRLGQRRARGFRAASSFFARAHHKPPCADDGGARQEVSPSCTRRMGRVGFARAWSGRGRLLPVRMEAGHGGAKRASIIGPPHGRTGTKPSLFERTSRARPRFPRARVRLRSPA